MRNKILSIILFLLAFNLVHSQNNDSIMEARFRFSKFGVKGKVLPWIMGNSGGINCVIGAEYGFAKNSTIGIDFFFYGTQDHRDQYFGQNDPRNGYSLDNYSNHKAVFFNYRYYFKYFYLGTFSVIGNRRETWDRGFEPSDSLSKEIRKYIGYGTMVGCKFRFKKKPKFGIDINLGLFYNRKRINSLLFNGPSEITTNGNFNTIDARISFNFFWFISKD